LARKFGRENPVKTLQKIRIACEVETRLPLQNLKLFQGNLKAAIERKGKIKTVSPMDYLDGNQTKKG
jgi:hypothetical protein